VDGIEAEMATRLDVLRVNIQDPVGRQLASLYDFEYTPTYIFFDARGHELWRTIGEIDPQRVRDSVGSQ
jgi:thioredoxin-related protein